MNVEVNKTKTVIINGNPIEFSRMDTRQTITEEVNMGFLGYFSEYYIDGAKITLEKTARFFR